MASMSESRFYMWRAIVAMIHADGVVTPHELSFISGFIQTIDLNKEQGEILGNDIRTPKSIHDMFTKIFDQEDQEDFFGLAKALSWCDGNFDPSEKKAISQLQEIYNQFISNEEKLRPAESMNILELKNDQWLSRVQNKKDVISFLRSLRKVA